MNSRLIKTLVIAALFTWVVPSAVAVTDKEMDEARAITAKLYLRWSNDGSGYLDDINAKSMSELESKLKNTEKENIKAFKKVAVPGDYASWNKEKLVEFWSSTFFTSPHLTAEGKRAKDRVRKKLQAMTVSAPAPAPAPAPAAETSAPAEEAAPAAMPQDMGAEANPMEAPTAETAIEQQQDILVDQKAIEQDAQDAEASRHEEKSNTWVYVLVLAILVGVVIWLVVYAANLMKRQPEGPDDDFKGDGLDVRKLQERLHNEESRAADLSMENERLKLENSRLLKQIETLRHQSSRQSAPIVDAPTAQRPAVTAPIERPAQRPVAQKPRQEAEPEATRLNTIYLGRANRRGIFVRADRRINPGNTVYKLDTEDGMVGTFHVIDSPEVLELVLANPVEYLATGCVGEELGDTLGVRNIVTESAGTAIFENGYWKVLRKTRIRYE